MNKKGNKFKVELRKKCKICGKEIKVVRFRTYCSTECRNKANYRKTIKKIGRRAFNERQREYLYKKALKKDKRKRIKCEICGKYFRQVGSHVYYTHKMKAREYREEFGFDVKRGQLPADLRELKGKYVFENGTVKNLKSGKKFWFKKGQRGVGCYERSNETMERLKLLYSFNKSRLRYEKS